VGVRRRRGGGEEMEGEMTRERLCHERDSDEREGRDAGD
jgi:hypothetical protein